MRSSNTPFERRLSSRNESGVMVPSSRCAQPCEATSWALPILADLGFSYDSSAFPGRLHRYGWPGMQASPHRIALAGGRAIIEFPAARFGLGSWSTQVRGGLYWRALPNLVNSCSSRGGCWYFHCYDLDPGYPLPVGLPWKIRLLKKIGTPRSPERFDRLLSKRRFRAHADAVAEIA